MVDIFPRCVLRLFRTRVPKINSAGKRKRKKKIMNPFIQLKTIVVVFVLLAWAAIAGAQSFPRLNPVPPKKDARVFKATPALAPGLTVATTDKPTSGSRLHQLRPWKPDFAHRRHCYGGRIMAARIGGNSLPMSLAVTSTEHGRSWLRCQTATARCITRQPFFPTAESLSKAANTSSPTESFTRSGQIRAPSMTRWPTVGHSWLLLRFLGALDPFRERSAMLKVSFSSTELSCWPMPSPETRLYSMQTLSLGHRPAKISSTSMMKKGGRCCPTRRC